jgi:(p)ppGpp synthase/HD superfamily hydrolase
MSTIEKALRIALDAHGGRKDKAGKPYILHPIRVGMRGQNEDEIIVGFLHDTIEDTRNYTPDKRITAGFLRDEGFSERQVAGVEAVTRREGERYLTEFIERVKLDPIGIRVKLYDLADNMDPSRKMDIPGWESLLRKYQKATDSLLAHLEIQQREKELRRLREAEGA